MDELDREILQDRSTQDLLAQMWEAEMDRRALLKRGAVIGAGAVALAAPATAAAALRGPAAAKLPRTFLYAYAGAAPRIDNNQNNLNVATATHAVYDNLVLFMWPNDFKQTQRLLAKSFSSLARPLLARGWAISKNYTQFRILLRRNVRSQFGNTLTADDVIWAVQKWFRDGGTSTFWMTATGLPDPARATKIDDHTVQFALPSPGPLFLLALGGVDPIIWDSTEAKKHATAADPTAREWLTRNPAGWGAYEMTLMDASGDRVAFRRRKTYWKPQTKQDVPIFIQQSVPEGGNRLSLLLADQAHYADSLTPLENELAKKRGMNVVHVDSTIVVYMVPHLKPPFDQREVRQAMAKAIPYDQIFKTVYRGTAKPYRSLLTPFVPGYTEKYWKYKTDIEAAKAVLSKLNTSLTLTIVEGLPVDQQTALLIQASFNRAGLPTTIQTINRANFAVQRRNGGLQTFLASYISPAFPTANYYGLVHCSTTGAFNYINFTNAAMDKAIADAHPGNPRSVQDAAADTMQRIAMEELPIIPIAWTGNDFALARFLKLPYARNAGGQIYWPDLQIDHTKL